MVRYPAHERRAARLPGSRFPAWALTRRGQGVTRGEHHLKAGGVGATAGNPGLPANRMLAEPGDTPAPRFWKEPLRMKV